MPCTCSFTRPAKGQFLLPLKLMAELPLTSVVQDQGLYALIRILMAFCDIRQTEWKTYQRSAPYTPSQRKSSAQETSRSFLLQRELRNHIKLFKEEKCWKYSLEGAFTLIHDKKRARTCSLGGQECSQKMQLAGLSLQTGYQRRQVSSIEVNKDHDFNAGHETFVF